MGSTFLNKILEGIRNIFQSIRKFFANSLPPKYEEKENPLWGTMALPVEEIMIPRSDIKGLPEKSSFSEVINTFLKTGFYALPVYRQTLDHIIGVVTIHCILALKESLKNEKNWANHLSAPSFSPSSLKIGEALQRLQNSRDHFIFIVDEYGGIEGMVSKGCIIKEIVQKYFSTPPEDQAVILSKEPELVVSGRIDLENFESEFGDLELSEEERNKVNTLGGWICSFLGRVPLNKEVITHPSGFVFEIQKADSRCIHYIAIKTFPPKK
jgi:magnesium and cobalt transporter